MRRRDFLAGALAGAAALAAGGRPARSAPREADLPDDGSAYDVVIAGGGVAGLYAAWRLAERGGLRVALLEGSDRVGGRLDTRTVAGMDHVLAEVGGMRFPPDHEIVNLLVRRFGLSTSPFPMTQNRQYLLRGRRLDDRSIAAGTTPPPYRLDPADLRLDPNRYANRVVSQVVGDFTGWTDANWQWVKENRTFDEMPLHEVGFWNLLSRVAGNEGYEYIADGGGYNSNVINWNAAEAMPYVIGDFTTVPDFRRLDDGFQALPDALAARAEALGCRLFRRCRLARFDPEGEGTILALERAGEPGRRVRIRAKALVLAMPPRSLALLDQDCEFFRDDRVRRHLQAVIPQHSCKLFLAYDRRWWDAETFRAGPTVTDLPLRMTYDFGSEEERGGRRGDTRTLLLASYSDMRTTTFWDVPHDRDPVAAYSGGPVPEEMSTLANGLLQQVLTTHGAAPRPEKPIGSVFRDWSQDPFGAGYHAWAAHFRPWEVMRAVRRPLPERPVYICGEAWSNAQAWVEGAVCTTESVLEEFFGLPRLEGLSPHYPLLSPEPVDPTASARLPGASETHPTRLHRTLAIAW